jgi:hypothetical protein
MALQPTQTNEEQRLRSQLLRYKASLETKKGSRSVALNISTDTKETPARRAEFAAKYKKLSEEIDDLEDKIDSTTKEVNKAKARKSLAGYDKEKGQKQLDDIKEQYGLLAAAYKLDQDPAIKSKIDTLVKNYKDVSTSVSGRPISLTAARVALQGNIPTPTVAPKPGPVGDASKIGPDSSGYVIDSVTGKRANGAYRTKTGGTMYFKDGVTVNADGTPFQPARNPDGTIATPPAPTQTPAPTTTPRPSTRTTSTGTTSTGTTGGRTSGATGGTTGGATSTPSTTAFPQYGGVDTTTLAGITAASARPPVGGAVVKGYDAALALAKEKYNLPDIIFSNVKSLGKILEEYVNGKIDIDLFKQKVANDPWYRQNSTEIKNRYLQKFNYEDLVKSGNAKGTTDYEQRIAQITNNLLTKARQIGSALDEGQAKLIAEDLYIHNQDADDAVVTRRLVSGIRPIAGMVGGKITEDFSGLALQNYQGLQSLAKRNGMKLENILPPGVDGKPATAQETLQRLALGELDPTRLAQDVRKLAAVGQPQFVRDLLGQGIDLDQIYSPYRRTMARVLELDEGQIDLMDPTLRMGINDKGDINLFDYEKSLRQDNRWQYTGNAREEVSNAALTVLRNFGFQG